MTVVLRPCVAGVLDESGNAIASLAKVRRTSPTLGQAQPPGAVVIQDDVEEVKITPAGPRNTEGTSGPLHPQNHCNPVRYRNISALPKL